jgi:serine/threonine protein kinase
MQWRFDRSLNNKTNPLIINDEFFTKLMKDITPFMKTIHTKNITHLDIKLDNIFQCKDKNNNIKYKIS